MQFLEHSHNFVLRTVLSRIATFGWVQRRKNELFRSVKRSRAWSVLTVRRFSAFFTETVWALMRLDLNLLTKTQGTDSKAITRHLFLSQHLDCFVRG
jgi:hypothetical protein